MASFKSIDDILNAPPDHLRAALRVFFSNDSDAQETLAEYLSTLHEACTIRLKPAAPFPLPSEFHLCEQCDKTFFKSENKHGKWECEQNEEAELWEQWRDWRDGPMEDADEDEYPEGFIWTCCKGDGKAKGCKVSRHKAHDEPLVPSQPANDASGAKRKRDDDTADHHICERCNKSFTEGKNGEDACSYHPCKLSWSIPVILMKSLRKRFR
ncbi:hypothetical protein B0T21DRAFT_60702 [Apiosordaria backusii]|uniref:C2H2-type domain-containing protein n=1 Tax=Apiosordaria backusii TaxID=314023 RepID=A0AA40ANF3_9PEZI|nr:hypothetical protein B0T21DRAFT_60702 [Apiosordaria backusii]